MATTYNNDNIGTADASVMVPICFDAMTLGNHEFNLGNTRLEEFIALLEEGGSGMCSEPTQVVAANVQAPAGSTLESQLSPYIIKTYPEKDDEKIAIIGLSTATTPIPSSPEESTIFSGEVEAIEAAVAEVQEMGINKIVLLTHTGYLVDTEDLSNIAGVDVIIGGHSHTILGDQDLTALFGASPEDTFPSMVNGVCVAHAWAFAHGIGELNVVFDPNGDVVSCEGSIRIPYDNTSFQPADVLDETVIAGLDAYLEGFSIMVPTAQNDDVAALVDQYEAELLEFGNQAVASVPDGICNERVPGGGRSLICTPEETLDNGGGVCNLVARSYLMQVPSGDIAMQNAGGCRVDIFAGEFTVNDAFTLLPFTNDLVTMEVTGAEIIEVLNSATNLAVSGESTGAYPYASGLRFEVDTNLEQPVFNVEVNIRLEKEWVAIDEDRIYTLVTNDFVAAGRDGYFLFAEIANNNLFLEMANTFIAYARDIGTLLDPPIEEYSTQMFTPRGNGLNV